MGETRNAADEASKTLEMLEKCLDYYYGNILIADGDGKILYVNDTLLKMYNITRERALSMTVYDLVKDRVLDRSAVIEVIKTGREAIIKLGITHSGASIDCVAKPVYENGAIKYIIAFSHDEIFMEEMKNELRIEKEKRQEMKDALSGYLGVLFDQDPASVGGAMPADDFYYMNE